MFAVRKPQVASRKLQAPGRKAKRTFKEEKEYADLPKRITLLEGEQKQLQAAIARPEFYTDGAGAIKKTLARVDAIEQELLTAVPLEVRFKADATFAAVASGSAGLSD